MPQRSRSIADLSDRRGDWARMLAAAEAYLAANGLGECDCRFDVVEVRMGADGLAAVELMRGAFMAGE